MQPEVKAGQAKGVFYLVDVDSVGRRTYERNNGLMLLDFAEDKKSVSRVGSMLQELGELGSSSSEEELTESRTPDDVAQIVQELVRQVAGLATTAELDADLPLAEVGFDSLLSVELRNALEKDLD